MRAPRRNGARRRQLNQIARTLRVQRAAERVTVPDDTDLFLQYVFTYRGRRVQGTFSAAWLIDADHFARALRPAFNELTLPPPVDPPDETKG